MLAARAAFLEQIVVPGLTAGRIVIADRFELSTLAYQGSGRGLPAREILACNRFATNDVSPDLTLLLELSPDEGARRQVAAAKRPDRMESEDREFHARVARGYGAFAPSIEHLARIDAQGSIDAVRERIISALRDRFPETLTANRVIS
jgi:dTMP kinase